MLSGYQKRQQAHSVQRNRVQDKTRVRNRKSNEFKVYTGWTQEWVSPDQLLRNTRLDVRDVIQGPFLSPKLLRTQPYIDRSCPETNGNLNYLRRGIPDAWREYLASRGHCGATEARVLQKNLISSYVRCLATDRLWNDMGLPFIQGIPDPWKNSPNQLQVTKRPWRLSTFKKNTIGQIVINYDADDEAETESLMVNHCDTTKQHNKIKDTPYSVQCESNLPPQDDKTFQTDERTLKCIANGKQNKINQITDLHNSKLPRCSRKNVNTIAKGGNIILKESVKSTPVTLDRGSLVFNEKNSDTKTTVKKRVRIDVNQKANNCVRAEQPQILQNFVCGRCKLQDLTGLNVEHPPNYRCLLDEVDVSQRVLCKNCEDVYRDNNRRRDLATDINAREPIPMNCSERQKTIAYEKMYKRTKLKFHGCIEKTKQHLKNFNLPGRMEGVNRIDVQDLRLVCCRCDCPYLRVASPDPIDQKTGCSDRSSGRIRKDRHIGPRECRRMSKCAVTRKHGDDYNDSENRCKTRAENKASVPKCDLEQPLHSAAGKRSEALKNVNKYPKSEGTSSD